MEDKRLQELADEFNEEFRGEHVGMCVEASAPNTLTCEIRWGDWKHDHLRLDWLMREFLERKGVRVRCVDSDVTEEDGSDCYSATHYFILA